MFTEQASLHRLYNSNCRIHIQQYTCMYCGNINKQSTKHGVLRCAYAYERPVFSKKLEVLFFRSFGAESTTHKY